MNRGRAIVLPAAILILACAVADSPPDAPARPNGPTMAAVNVSVFFSTASSDRNGDSIAYRFYWGDGTKSAWTRFTPNAVRDSMSKSWPRSGTYSVRAIARDGYGEVSDSSDGATILIVESLPNRAPTTPAAPTGPDSGRKYVIYGFTAVTTDPDGNDICYQFDWGNGASSDWSPLVHSGSAITDSSAWNQTGTFDVRARARDSKDVVSDWSGVHPVTITDSTLHALRP